MILTIDIGNTTVSLGGLERDPEQGYTVHFCGKIDTVPAWKTTDYLREIRWLLKKKKCDPSVFEGKIANMRAHFVFVNIKTGVGTSGETVMKIPVFFRTLRSILIC